MQKYQQLQVDKKVHEFDDEVESKSEEKHSDFGTIDLYQLKQEPDPNQLDLDLFFDAEDEETNELEVEIDHIQIFEVLNHPNVHEFLQFIADLIIDQYRREPKFSVLARVKTIVFFQATELGNFKRFHRMLQEYHDVWGPKLGYHSPEIPAYSTLRQFLRDKFGTVIEEKKSAIIGKALGTLEKYGIKPGWRGIMDSTPYEASPADKNASYSTHYKMRGYKEHRLIDGDTDVPLGWKVTPNTDYDGHHADDLLQQATDAGAGLFELWFDGHYTSFNNIADFVLNWGLKTHFRIQEHWSLDKSVDEDRIRKAYNLLHSDDDYLIMDNEDCTLQFMLKFIYNKSWFDSHEDLVGKFLRNRMHESYEETPKQYLAKQGFRSRIEGGFGVEKTYSSLKLVEIRGLKSWKAYLGLRNVLDLGLSIFWADLGRKTNLTSSKELVI